MKLSVSNIAWNEKEEDEILDLLAGRGVQGIEAAPTRLWPAWQGATLKAANATRAALAKRGFAVPAVQAILFGRPDFQLFGPPEIQTRLLDHIAHVASLAEALGAGAIIFGSPKNRDPGTRSAGRAFEEAIDFFRRAGERCAPRGVRLCVESNPRAYGCSFMTHWHEVRDLVNYVSHAGVAIHLDSACIAVEGDDVVEAVQACAGRIAHFHVAEPNLGDFSKPEIDHAAIGRALREGGYDGWLSIEMRRTETPMRSIDEAVSRVMEWYE